MNTKQATKRTKDNIVDDVKHLLLQDKAFESSLEFLIKDYKAKHSCNIVKHHRSITASGKEL